MWAPIETNIPECNISNHDSKLILLICLIVSPSKIEDETIKNKQREIAEKHGYDLLDQSVILYVRKKKN